MTAEQGSEPAASSFADSDYVDGMERLVHAIQELSLARTLPDLQRIVRSSARELTGCDGATFVLRDNDSCYYADEDAIAPLWKGSRFPIGSCISGWAMLNRDAAVIPDIYGDPRIPHALYRPTFVKSLVMVPIRKLEPIGAIGNYWASRHQPSDQEVHLLQALADSTSIAMENVRVYSELERRVRDRTAALEDANEEIRRLSVTDELTGLNNRRGFYLLAEQKLRGSHHLGHNCVLAFLDVDGLKKVNDELGHDTGDKLIKDVAGVLRTIRRESDILARIGGDEFCVMITESDGDTPSLEERLALAFGNFNKTSERPYRLSASIGFVRAPVSDTANVGELLARADELMYAQKKASPNSRLAG
ncbi:sensor domain-containing diguanylate cyclase [Mycobacterium intracellulare]|uniref:Sensor domain-containing diguanylate cyclase n=1 Tax=Mycobacterium intracellulare TaxID=1767 RepID=A0AAE4UDE6_MYCIT|nr:sensor domain-containing diguanylate cyclase [Mycobacterium intracellulare]MCA2322497.1 sensor domain-containing diguanylate cyclase [Mycobacterium intracellulare]MCA2343703.1 sensor domain-containing diguanylate cyclase [Mycobacterium intracellulare]MDV6978812.1 sensor domain-containing diguanylate cyclase [Mycobacterium intracellulare]MDV6984118.1 sensor domain-containing diguanylate cyclase [Mycobacterium intracellulare]MDV7014532.1 sensor domain-containing diguanylate cyclase [Mycobacte